MRSLLVVLLLTSVAQAQQLTPQQKAAADALFDAGKQAMAAGDYAKACPKFEESLKIVPQLGTHLNLANCYAKQGRTASAWAEFRASATEARKQNDQREEYAKQQAALLEPKLDRITVSAGGGTTVTVDGIVVNPPSYGVPFPVDPGDHIVAAGKWSQTVHAKGTGETIDVAVPGPSAAQPPPPHGAVEAHHEGNGRRTAGIVVASLGVAIAGGSGALALVAKSHWNDAAHSPGCDAQLNCDAPTLKKIDDARSLGNIATVGFVVGVAAAATGVVIAVTAPRRHKVEVSGIVAPTGGALVLGGSW